MDRLNLTKKQIKIFETSVGIIQRKGYVSATMRDIAKYIDVQAPSLYAHIKSKEEIFDWICKLVLLRLFDDLDELSEQLVTPKEKFILAVKLYLNTIYSDVNLFDVFLNNINRIDLQLSNSEHYRERYQDFFNQYENIIYEYLLVIKLEEKANLKETAKFAMNVLTNLYRWKPINELDIDTDAEFLHRMLVFGTTGERNS